jgi:uncharacterized protein YlxW (UPF0749 family)
MTAALVTSLIINVLLIIAFAMSQSILADTKKKLAASREDALRLADAFNQIQKNRKQANEKINHINADIDNALDELSKH